MEDPLFDPWGDEPPSASGPARPVERGAEGSEATAPPSESRAPRWRSPGATTGVPLSRPAPQPVSAAAPLPSPEPPPPEPAAARTPEPPRTAAPGTTPARPVQHPATTVLREIVLPRIRHFVEQLQAARHETLLDDRTHEDAPSIRFQIRPRRGPFDGSDGLGPVLELVPESDHEDAPALLARLWADPAAESPAVRTSVPLSDVSHDRVDRILLDFVDRALRGH